MEESDGGKEELWFDADAELVEEIARNAKLHGETVAEFVSESCRQRADREN